MKKTPPNILISIDPLMDFFPPRSSVYKLRESGPETIPFKWDVPISGKRSVPDKIPLGDLALQGGFSEPDQFPLTPALREFQEEI